MLILMILALFIFIIIIDLLPNFKENSKKMNIIYITILAISFIVTVFFALEVPFPSPSTYIKIFIEKIFGKQV